MSRLKILLICFLTQWSGSLSYVAIEQCPGSDVPRIREQTQHNEVSLIFYYTRWSADSLVALKEYNDVAEYYSDKIYFSSIDCWHLSCNCSRALTTTVGSGLPHKWPTLMAYYGRRGQLQIQYHGLWAFNDIQQFVDNLLQPLERFRGSEDLDQLRIVSDALVLGIFETPDSREYKQYLMASLKWLESDPLRTYRFTVIFATNTTKHHTGGGLLKDVEVPNLLFMGASGTNKYGEVRDDTWNASNILFWLHWQLKADLNRLHGYATPITIAQKLVHNSVLAIFVNDPLKFFRYMETQLFLEKPYSVTNNECSKLTQMTQFNDHLEAFRIQYVLEQLNIYSDERKCYYNLAALFKYLSDYYEINRYLDNLFLNLAYPSAQKNDLKRQTKDLLNFHHVTKCLNSDISTSNSLQLGVVKRLQAMVEHDMDSFKSNRSIAVVLLDAERYKDYLENLDVVAQPQSMATTLLIDKGQESKFVMTDTFTIPNLREFIHHFYKHNLMPYFRSERLQLHSASRSFISSDNYEVKNLNRFTFLNHLHYAHNQTLILLIHSPECALCGTLQHTFIQLASALRHLSPELQFVRINALLNDLPWQFNMASLPALLVFPKKHFGDSRLFPSYLKPDLRSVFAFILNQLSPEDQMKVVVTFCQSQTLSPEHSQSCWKFAKTQLTFHIGRNLHYWQLFENERSLIFERLRAFNDMSLDLQRNLRL